MKVYIAHQISGLSFDEVVSYYEGIRREFQKMGYEVLCPMTAKGFLRNEVEFKSKGYNNPVSTNHAIAERDMWMVNDCDVLYCDFTGSTHALIGCIFELAWAHLWRKHTVTVIPKTNVHQHAFILEASDIVFETEEEALKYMEYLIAGRIE